MDATAILQTAIQRAKFARQTPVNRPSPPAPKPVPEAKNLAPRLGQLLPGTAPWRDDAKVQQASIAPFPRLISVRQVIDVVAAEFQITVEQIKGHYRTREFVFPRHIAQYLAMRVTKQSLPIIGRAFYRDHTSVMNGVRNIKRLIDEDSAVFDMVRRLETKIRNHDNP